jgi:hypothetical protein
LKGKYFGGGGPRELCVVVMILSSANNLNTENAFVGMTEQLLGSNSGCTYLSQAKVFSKFRLYLPDKI